MWEKFEDETDIQSVLEVSGEGPRVLLGAGLIGYFGPGMTADTHCHHAVQLVWSLGRRFEIDGELVAGRVALVPGGVLHSLAAGPDEMVVILVDPYAQVGRALQAVAGNVDSERLHRDLTRHGPPPCGASAARLHAWCEGALEAAAGLSDRGERPPGLRDEILRTLDYVDREIGGMPRLAAAARTVGLSPSRLTHVFTEQIGLPFRRYVLWRRLGVAAVEVQRGGNLTTAAAVAGFADSAHLTRVFRSTFGLAPSQILSNAEIVGALASGRGAG